MSHDAPDIEMLQRVMLLSPHSTVLGFTVISAGTDHVMVRAPWRAELAGGARTDALASGVITALLDHACGLAAGMLGAVRVATPTLDLRIDTMRAAAPRAAVVARAHCYKRTRAIAFVRATAWDVDEDDPLATAQAAFALPERHQ